MYRLVFLEKYLCRESTSSTKVAITATIEKTFFIVDPPKKLLMCILL